MQFFVVKIALIVAGRIVDQSNKQSRFQCFLFVLQLVMAHGTPHGAIFFPF